MIGVLSATAGAAVGADKATFLIYEGLLTAVGAYLSLGCSAVEHVFLQGTFNADFPGVDTFAIELQ